MTVAPDEGYQLTANSLKDTYNDGAEKELDLTQDTTDQTKYTFTMPDSKVNVELSFKAT